MAIAAVRPATPDRRRRDRPHPGRDVGDRVRRAGPGAARCARLDGDGARQAWAAAVDGRRRRTTCSWPPRARETVGLLRGRTSPAPPGRARRHRPARARPGALGRDQRAAGGAALGPARARRAAAGRGGRGAARRRRPLRPGLDPGAGPGVPPGSTPAPAGSPTAPSAASTPASGTLREVRLTGSLDLKLALSPCHAAPRMITPGRAAAPGRWSARGARRTARTAISTPGMNEARSSESCRMVSVSPGVPSSTSWCATRPGSRTECTRTPSTLAPRAPGSSSVVASGSGPAPASARAAAISDGGAGGGAGRGVDLAGVVQLDHLDRVEEPGRLPGELHHQHRADAEVRGDQHVPGVSASQPRTVLEALLVEPAGADHDGDAVVEREPDVVQHRAGMGEVDDHLGAGVDQPRRRVALVEARDQRQVRGGLDRAAHLAAHAPRAPSTPPGCPRSRRALYAAATGDQPTTSPPIHTAAASSPVASSIRMLQPTAPSAAGSPARPGCGRRAAASSPGTRRARNRGTARPPGPRRTRHAEHPAERRACGRHPGLAQPPPGQQVLRHAAHHHDRHGHAEHRPADRVVARHRPDGDPGEHQQQPGQHRHQHPAMPTTISTPATSVSGDTDRYWHAGRTGRGLERAEQLGPTALRAELFSTLLVSCARNSLKI